MNFLTPLYALAALTVALPILFHLIRKRPKDVFWFSSLMFLEPSPPKLTKQSSIDQWLLLLLRALALTLLAVAFTRPYWNVPSTLETNVTGMRRLILMDTSGSMQRPGAWQNAVDRANAIVSQSNPLDTIAAYAFDKQIRPLVSLEEASATIPSQRHSLVLSSIANAKPGWFETDLGLALTSAADILQSENDGSTDSSLGKSEIVLITDFQNGMQLDKLNNYNWPDLCSVRIERILPTTADNARAVPLVSPEATSSQAAISSNKDETTERADDKVRVRVVNQSTGGTDKFTLNWLDANNVPVPNSTVTCTVSPSSSLVVKLPPPPTGSYSLQLNGDNSDFDNQYFAVAEPASEAVITLLETPDLQPEHSLAFFATKLPLGSPTKKVRFETVMPNDQLALAVPSTKPLVIASHQVTDANLIALKDYVTRGGHLLWVWDADTAKTPSTATNDNIYVHGLSLLTELGSATVSEASIRNYAMLEQIDFRHPLFRDLSDPKFNDFTKVRFWSHRKVAFADESQWNVLARFDTGSPAIIERGIGAGKLWLMTSGWQPTQSQLALSSKFVPFISGVFRLSSPTESANETLLVGDTITEPNENKIVTPDGNELIPIQSNASRTATETASASGSNRFELPLPGIYRRLLPDGQSMPFAVNLNEAESLTSISDVERLDRLGVRFSDQRPVERKETAERQMRAVELEAQQGWWRWMLLVVIGVVGIESLVCIRRTAQI